MTKEQGERFLKRFDQCIFILFILTFIAILVVSGILISIGKTGLNSPCFVFFCLCVYLVVCFYLWNTQVAMYSQDFTSCVCIRDVPDGYVHPTKISLGIIMNSSPC